LRSTLLTATPENTTVAAAGRPLGRVRRALALGPPGAFTAPRLPACGSLPADAPLRKRTLVIVFGGFALLYGLLWSPWWYPLSDSALYLSLARNLCEGRGYTFLGGAHRQVPPLYALLLAGMLSISRWFAWLHVSSIVGTWLSLVLSYVALRRWLPGRIALVVVAITGATFWYYQNAMVLMAEPLFLCLLWLSAIGLGRCCDGGRIRPGLLALGLACYVLAFATRLAACLLVPGMVIALWYGSKHLVGVRRRLLVCAALVAVAVTAWGAYVAWGRWYPEGPVTPPADRRGAAKLLVSTPASEYRMRWQRTKMPETGAAGRAVRIAADLVAVPARWLGESMVAASAAVFTAKSRAVRVAGYVAAAGALALVLIGAVRLARCGWHWLVWPMTYMLPILLEWRDRMKPRYVNPVVPLIVLAGLVGLWTTGQWLRRVIRSDRAARLAGRLVVPMAVGLVLAGNLPPYLGELYVRHLAGSHYYNVARQGAYAEAVNAAAHVRRHDPAGGAVAINYAPLYRVIHLMTGRPLVIVDVAVASPEDRRGLRKVRRATPDGTVIIIYFSGRKWPVWHFGTNQPDSPYWGAYRRDARGRLERIHPDAAPGFLLRVPSGRI